MVETRDISLRCTRCAKEQSFALTVSQVRQLRDSHRLQFYCRFCSGQQYWEATAKEEELITSTPEATEPRRILVVDDDDLTLRLLRKVLEAWDAKIEVAENGKEALSKLAAQPFDLMVCDIQMPEMSGQELFQHIAENAYLPPQRIIFLTGDKSLAVKQFLDRTGCYYCYKPLEFLEFSSQVEALLQGQTPD